MKLTPELVEAAEVFEKQAVREFRWHSVKEGFLAGAHWAYERGRRGTIKLLRSVEADDKWLDAWVKNMNSKGASLGPEDWADWLESKLAALDARTGETLGEGSGEEGK